VQHVVNALSINISSLLGTGNAFVGFTWATGSGFANRDIWSWQITNDRLPGTPGLRQPGALALVAACLLGAAKPAEAMSAHKCCAPLVQDPTRHGVPFSATDSKGFRSAPNMLMRDEYPHLFDPQQ
jgi:hypothetical protein